MSDLPAPLPAPLTAPDCDLRGYDFMPLFGHRLFRSDLYEQTDGEQFKVAVKLWWEAWNQCPAGSLPDDDHKLARLADLGRDVKSWRRMRDAVLRGFILCSDGRLYHKALCEWATDAYERRVRDRDRKRKWRGTKREGDGDTTIQSHGQDGKFLPSEDGDNQESPRRGDVPAPLTGEERTGEDRKEDKKEDNLSSFNRNSRAQGDEATPGAVVPANPVDGVVTELRKAMRPTSYPPRKPIRDAQDQVAIVGDAPRPKALHLSAEQLAAARQIPRRSQ